MPPTNYTVERTATMKADPARVFSEVVDFHRWPGWSPWEDLDPDLERSYDGPQSGVGAVYSWSGNRKAGEGRMEITHADEPSSVVVDLRFLKPFRSRSTTTFTFAPEGTDSQGDQVTRVTWTMTGPRTLMVKVMGVVTSMDKMIGKDFEKGLARLRTQVESPAS